MLNRARTARFLAPPRGCPNGDALRAQHRTNEASAPRTEYLHAMRPDTGRNHAAASEHYCTHKRADGGPRVGLSGIREGEGGGAAGWRCAAGEPCGVGSAA